MATRREEIQREDWIPFLDEFTREHQGWQVDLEVQVTGGDEQIEAREVPLQGISADVKDGEHRIAIIVGEEQNPGLTHIVAEARRLQLERTDVGNDSAIEIESAGGETTVLRLRDVRRAA